jgi:hypothetical protein
MDVASNPGAKIAISPKTPSLVRFVLWFVLWLALLPVNVQMKATGWARGDGQQAHDSDR